jgi:hypothetical protein
MKKLLLLLYVPLILSCKQSIKNINFSEMQDECEILDAANMLYDQALEHHAEHGDVLAAMPEDIRNEILVIFDKIEEMSNEFHSPSREITREKLEGCPNFKEVDVKSRKLFYIDGRYDD